MKSRTKRRVTLAVAVLVLVVVGLATYTYKHVSPAGPAYTTSKFIPLPYRLRNSEEHDAARTRNGGNPYILEFETPDAGSLLYYGASHVSDPKHPQVEDITTRWNNFKPTVALYEGRSRNQVFGALIEPFAGLPEPALVHKLARRDGIPLYTLEPSYADEVTELLRTFSPEQISLYFFLRVYIGETGGRTNDKLAIDLLKKRTDVDGIRGSLNTLDDVTRVWETSYAELGDWRTQQHEPESGFMTGVSDASRRIRGEHMARALVDLVSKGERVFAVVGSGHVIRQEWNLRALLGQEPAWDQPRHVRHY